MKRDRSIVGGVGVIAIGAFLGCAGPAPEGEPTTAAQADAGADSQYSTATFQLTVAPTGAQCIRIVTTPASGSPTTQTFAVTAGASTATLTMTGVPTGADTFTGNAFNVVCSSIGSAAPTWAADPLSTTVRAGVPAMLMLTFRPVGAESASVNFVSNLTGIAAGGYNTYALTDGAPYAWGVFTGPSSSTFSGITAPTAIASGPYHSCAVKPDGTVWCWGYNYYGGVGPNIAVGSVTFTPVQVPLPFSATLVSAGNYHSCAYGAAAGGTVYCWGYNADGELGNGTTTNTATPVLALSGTVRSLAAGQYSNIAVTGDGHYAGWGSNTYGQLGDGTTTNRTTAVRLATDSAVVAAATGYHTCLLHADGSIACLGANFYGQIGDGTTLTRATSTKVTLPAAAKSIGVGYAHSCALLVNGQVMCWGDNIEGEIGDLTGVNHPTPTAPAGFGGETPAALAVGTYHNCVLTTAPNVWCWGGNFNGGVGDGTYDDAFGPLKVTVQ
ncbi:MAG TPA: hypothetical protein VH853_17880 [Polyangia bacterium]|jgi:alpha-tubulin suppressor-like RCC1 family protein|nr:hypothetical protein [Polyangia bacterium]